MEEIEDSVLGAQPSQDQIGRIYQLRRDLLRLRNAAIPLVEVCRRLEKPGLPGIDAAMYPLFRDVSDHIRQVQEEIESLREVLSFAFETSLMTGQAQQTEITRKLAAWAAILAVPTAVAGHLRHELRRAARAALEIRLSLCARGHRRWFVAGCTGASARSSGSRQQCQSYSEPLARAAAKGWPHGGIPRLWRPWNAAHPSRSRLRLHTR